MSKSLTVDGVREALIYESATGLFSWRIRPAMAIPAGVRAGSKNKAGYITIRLKGKSYLAHRLAWLYVHGVMPLNEIDHLNGTRDDNRIANLRQADRKGNCENVRKPLAGNKSGYLGVSLDPWNGKWLAQISIGGKKKRIGCFDSPELAHQAYLETKRRVHAGCTL